MHSHQDAEKERARRAQRAGRFGSGAAGDARDAPRVRRTCNYSPVRQGPWQDGHAPSGCLHSVVHVCEARGLCMCVLQGRVNRKARKAMAGAAGDGTSAEEDWDAFVVRGTQVELEKSYFRRAAACAPYCHVQEAYTCDSTAGKEVEVSPTISQHCQPHAALAMLHGCRA